MEINLEMLFVLLIILKLNIFKGELNNGKNRNSFN